jgi:hypothetical protein
VGTHLAEHQRREAAFDWERSDDAQAKAFTFLDLEGVIMENDSDSVGGYAVPVDPMDLLQCDSCQ